MTTLQAIMFFRNSFPKEYPTPPGYPSDATIPIKQKQWEHMVDLYVASAGLCGGDMEAFRLLCEAGLRIKDE